MESGHLLHSTLTCPSSGNARHFKSRRPICIASQQFITSSDDNNNRRAVLWADHQWKAEWLENIKILCTSHFHSRHRHPLCRIGSAKTVWVLLKGLCTDVGRFRSCLPKLGVTPSAACECGSEEQTVDHVILHCPIHGPPRAGLNQREAWSKVVTARLPKHLVQLRSVSYALV